MKFRNSLLSAFPEAVLREVLPSLTERHLERGEVLFEPGEPARDVFFPSNAVVSVVTTMINGQGVESSSIGHETATPLLAVLAEEPITARMFAQIGGGGVSMSAEVLRAAVAASTPLNRLLLRHVTAIGFQAEQGVACNALHEASSRLARWILMTQDRTGGRSLPLTQDYMAVMTGVQRTTISAVANQLRADGLIRYSRGNLEVLDRPRLEAHACECYRAVRGAFIALEAAPQA